MLERNPKGIHYNALPHPVLEPSSTLTRNWLALDLHASRSGTLNPVLGKLLNGFLYHLLMNSSAFKGRWIGEHLFQSAFWSSPGPRDDGVVGWGKGV